MPFFLLFLVLLTGCSGPYMEGTAEARQDAPRPTVDTVAVEEQVIPEVVTANGELFAEDRATISTKVAGRLKSLSVDLGSLVKAGDVLAQLEQDDYLLAVQQAEALVQQTRARLGLGPNDPDTVDAANTAQVRQADAELKESRFVYETTEKLFKEGVVSNVDYMKSKVRLDGVEARRQAAVEEIYRTQAELIQRKAQLALARQHLEDTVLRAPFDGAIVSRRANIGEYLPVNTPVCEIVRAHPMRIRLSVPEREAHKIRAGQRIELHLESTDVTRAGRVVRLSPAIQAESRSLIVEGELPNLDGSLRAGSFVQANITVRPDARGVAVPRRAVMSFAGVDRVFVVADGKLEERIVRLGPNVSDSHVAVIEGLQAGVRVVLNPSDRFTNGMAVDVRGGRPS